MYWCVGWEMWVFACVRVLVCRFEGLYFWKFGVLEIWRHEGELICRSDYVRFIEMNMSHCHYLAVIIGLLKR